MALSDQDRSKLDGIVQQAQQNGESDDFIQGMVNDFKSKYDSSQAAQPQGPQTYSGQGYMGDTSFAANHPGGLAGWAQDAMDDLWHGGSRTTVGKLMGMMGYTPIGQGVSPQVGEFMGGPFLGPLRVVKGVGQLPSQPLAGAGNIVGGAAQAAGPFQALLIPGMAEGASNVVGQAGNLLSKGAGAAADLVPTASHAAEALDRVAQAANDLPVDINSAGNVALKARELASAGGKMPKVLTDFITRVTKPGSKPMNYAEARNFVSNASRLSADEYNRLTGPMKRLVGQFTQELHGSIAETADQVGMKDTYLDAIGEYSNAMRLNSFGRKAGSAALKTGLDALKLGGALKLYNDLKE